MPTKTRPFVSAILLTPGEREELWEATQQNALTSMSAYIRSRALMAARNEEQQLKASETPEQTRQRRKMIATLRKERLATERLLEQIKQQEEEVEMEEAEA